MRPMPAYGVSASCLLTGTLLIIVAGALHPALTGDGAAQLAAIAHCDAWRAIHWAFLFGFGFSLTGLAGLAPGYAGAAGEAAARAGLIVGAFAYAAWLVIVAFMLGSGWALAQSYAVSDPGMTATHAVFLYDMLRPFGLAAQRLAGFTFGISTILLGWSAVRGRVLPRWLAWTGVGAGTAAALLAAAFGEGTKADQAAFVLPVFWQATTALVVLARRVRLA
ncbi:MAG TPA: hypothetical protein VLV16_13585 [Gemmatimonadales bacterium]|nr:hypothetical protein [Gemmatimonadales bacterium]